MARNRKRKTERNIVPDSVMREAVELVQSGQSIRKVAKQKTIKKSTLFRYVTKVKRSVVDLSQYAPKYNSRQIFSSEEEQDLADYMITCSNMCYGLTTQDCRKLAFQLGIKNEKILPKPWMENKMAGIDWFYGFMKRHP